MLEDLLDGKTKFHNVFHYPTRSWADVGIIAWLVDAAAIVASRRCATPRTPRTRAR
jgi:ring-1,2-phenylacetyl-CoA epoxidase subunit PaaA